MSRESFESLRDEHVDLLAEIEEFEDYSALIPTVRAFIERVRRAGRFTSQAEERDFLRSILNFWGSFVYEHSEPRQYPNIELYPLEVVEEPVAKAPMWWSALPLVPIIVGGVLLLVLAAIGGYFALRPSPATPTPVAQAITAYPTSTPYPTYTPVPTDTPTVAAPTNTPTSTPTKTPIHNSFPPDGGEYPYGDEESLKWAWNGNLGDDGIYSVRVWRKENLSEPCIHTQTEKTEYRFDPNACPGTNEFCWSVQAVRPDGKDGWEPLSSSSKRTCFSIAKSPIPAPILLPIREDNIGQLVSIADIHAHTGPVLQVSFSPDGRLLASSGGDGTFKLWSVPNGELLAEVPDHEGWTQSVSFSPDGKWIASGDSGHTVRLWDANTLGLVAEFAQHEGFVFNCTFSPDTSLIASASGDGTVRLWNIKTGQEQAVLPDSEIAVYEVSFSPDGTKLATASIDGWVQIWDVSTATPFCKRYSASVLSVAFSPDGNSIAAGNMDGHVLIIKAANCGKEQVLESHIDNVNGVAYSPGGEILVSGSRDSSVLAWTLSPSPIPIIIGEHQSWVESVAFSPDGSLIASGSADGVVILWGVGE